MGRIRRDGYVFEWWVGDHPPRHVHVSSIKGELLGRIRPSNKTSVGTWKPPRRVLRTIEDLQIEGLL